MKMLMMDAQTSGGLLICCDPSLADKMVHDLHKTGYPHSAIIGEVRPQSGKFLEIV
jgi:hydrogenase maturation factor